MSVLSPTEVVEANAKAAVGKATSPAWRLLLLGILAGIFIGIGAVASSTAAHAIGNVGLARLVSGLVFPVGLCLVVLLGAELFTGNSLMAVAVANRNITWKQLLRNWALVFVGNLIGSLLLAAAMAYFGQFDIAGGAVGTYAAKVASAKVALPWLNAFVLGVFCNLLVCAAVYLGLTAKSTAGKILALFLPIIAFVTCGFEHSVANMYYVPAGIFADQHYGLNLGLNFGQFFISLIPVTLGNIIGGAGLGLALYYSHRPTKSAVAKAKRK